MRNVCCAELHWLFPPVSGTVSRIVSRFVAVARTVLSNLGSDPAYATHHHLVFAASVDSDLIDKIVNLRSTRICNVVADETVVTFAASCTGHHRDQRCRRVHLHWCGLLVLTAVRTVTITSIISSEASRLSFVCSPLGQCISASQARTSRFDIIGTSCVALRILEHLFDCTVSAGLRILHCARLELTQLNGVGTVPNVRFLIALVVENELVLPPSHHAWTLWGYVTYGLSSDRKRLGSDV